jgi:superoxide dismutase
LAWYNTAAQHVEIATSANQEFLQALAPLLVVGVLEHANYLKKVWDVIN